MQFAAAALRFARVLRRAALGRRTAWFARLEGGSRCAGSGACSRAVSASAGQARFLRVIGVRTAQGAVAAAAHRRGGDSPSDVGSLLGLPATLISAIAPTLASTGNFRMSLIPRFLLLGLAAAAVLVGIQAPNFVDQYEKRLDAHFIEVRNNLAPFQNIADRFHGGELEALIAHHERSADPSFQAEGAAIRNLSTRLQRFEQEKLQLQTELPQQLVWLARSADRELIDETRRAYSFGLLLDRQAVITGLVSMLVVVVLYELLAALLRLLLRPRRA